MTTTLVRIPDKLQAGDTWKWTVSLSDYLASDSWVLSYALVHKSIQRITITATASADDHQVTVAASTTAAYRAGTYKYQAYVTKSTERYLIESGTVEILPDYSVAGIYDDRTTAQKMVDALETALISGASKGDIIEYSIGGRTIKRDAGVARRDLQYWKAIVVQEKRKERISRGLATSNNVKVKFT